LRSRYVLALCAISVGCQQGTPPGGPSGGSKDRIPPPVPAPIVQRVASAAFSPDKESLLVGYTAIKEQFYPADGFLGLWDVQTGKFLRRFPGHKGQTASWVAFLPSGKTRALSASKDDGVIKLWDLSRPGDAIRIFAAPEPMLNIALTPDGERVLTGHKDGRIRVFEVATGRLVRTLAGIEPATVLTCFEGGKGLLVGCGDGMLQHWDLDTGRLVREFLEPGKPPLYGPIVISVSPSPDGRLAFLRRRAGKGDPEGLRVWNVATGQKVWTLPNNDFQSDPAFSPDGELLVAAGGIPAGDAVRAGTVSSRRRLILRETLSGRVVRSFDERPNNSLGASGDTQFLALTPDGQRLRSVEYAGTTRIWEVASGRQIWSERMDWDGNQFLSPDGTLAFTPNPSVHDALAKRLKIWDSFEGKFLQVLDWPQ